MKRFYLGVMGLLAGLAMLLGMGVTAQAATANTYLFVYTEVAAYCAVYTSSVYFGTYTGATVAADGAVYVGCNTSQTPYEVALDGGQNSAGIFNRRMTNFAATSFLSYQLYDSGYSNWGDNDVSAYGPPEPGNSGGGMVWNTHTVHGYLWGAQLAEQGFHYDNVYVTVNY